MQVCTSHQTDNHASTPPLSFFTGRMPFLPPNQQRQNTEGINDEQMNFNPKQLTYTVLRRHSFKINCYLFYLADDMHSKNYTVNQQIPQ